MEHFSNVSFSVSKFLSMCFYGYTRIEQVYVFVRFALFCSELVHKTSVGRSVGLCLLSRSFVRSSVL